MNKKVNKKVQGMPISQITANPRYKEEEKKVKKTYTRKK